MRDELEQLINDYWVRASSSEKSKLDALLDIERIADPRVVPFLVELLSDRHESVEVRTYLVKRLRNQHELLASAHRPLVATAVGQMLRDDSNVQLRLQAALTLGGFTDVNGVLARLCAASLAQDESIDVRYAAFTSVERAGPAPESIALMRLIAGDEALRDAARSVLSAWHVAWAPAPEGER